MPRPPASVEPTILIVFETHSITEDNEDGIATRWGLDHLISGTPLEDLAAADFAWQEGWGYRLR